MPAKDKYTDPELREEVKKDIQDGDKGGAPGQWSARKAQFMASEYKKRGGSYNTDKKDRDESQKNLSKWGEEEWQTKEGSGDAKQADGTQKRYLPKKAWEEMTEEEKKETDEKKLKESKEGKQFVQNTANAKSARGKVNKEENEKYKGKKAKERQVNKKNGNTGDRKTQRMNGSQDHEEDDEEEYEEEEEEEGDEEDGEEVEEAEQGQEDEETKSVSEDKTPKKRGRKAISNRSNKKQKTSEKSSKQKGTIGSKHDPSDAPAPQASASRLPKKGQEIHWKALPGWVSGECIEVVRSEKEVEGKKVKGKKDDPRIVMRSKNGKIAVHKPEAVYFE